MSEPAKQLELFPDPKNNEPETTIIRWKCPNCGQQIFTAPDEAPPDMCAYCQDMTTWQRIPPPRPDDKE